MEIYMEVKCPYCNHIQGGIAFEVSTTQNHGFLVCQGGVTYGGCGKQFAYCLKLKPHLKTSKLIFEEEEL